MAQPIESISVRSEDRPYRRIPEAPAILAELWIDEHHKASYYNKYNIFSLIFSLSGVQQPVDLFSIFLNLPSRFVHESPLFSQPRSAYPEVVEAFDRKLRNAERALDETRLERTLAEASSNRRGIAALMEEEWLGLRALAQLRSSGSMSVTDLASGLKRDLNSVAANLAQLVRFGAVEVAHGKFACTHLADELLSSVEKNTKVSLKK